MEIILNTHTSHSQRQFPLRETEGSRDQLQKRDNQIGKRIEKMMKKEESSLQSASKKSSQAEDESIENKIQRVSKIKARLVGICLLAVIIGILFAYGFSSNINIGYFTQSQHFSVGITLFLSFIFVVIGFGLFLGYYVENIFTAIFTALYVVSLTVILSPLLQKFWLNIFLNGFNTTLKSSSSNLQVLFNSNAISNVSINYSNIKLSVCCAISQLIIHVSVIGRMQIYKTIVISFIFIILWNVNYFLCIYVLQLSPDSRFFDDYSISMVYVFGGFASLMISFDVPSNLHLTVKKAQKKIYPKISSFVGIFFIWLSFCFTFSIIGTKQGSTSITDQVRSVFYPQGCLQMFFALSSSTVSTLAFSYLLNAKPRVTDLLNGSISGAILFGSVAGWTTNISVPIAVGIFSAFLSTLYKSKIMKLFNKERVRDMLGLFGPFLFVSIFGVIVLSPIVIRSFVSLSISTTPLYGNAIKEPNEAGWILIYAGISAGIGLITGMVSSTVIRCFSSNQTKFGDRLLFIQDLNVIEKDLDYTIQKSVLQE